jgi:hypothetical protein
MNTDTQQFEMIRELRQLYENMTDMVDPSTKENPALERAMNAVLGRIEKELGGEESPAGTYKIQRFEVQVRTPHRTAYGPNGPVARSMGRPLCAVTSPHIPDCRVVRINGEWFRKCECFDAEYQEKQFAMDPEKMDF